MAKDPYILDDQVGYLMRLASQRHAAIFQAHTLEGLTAMQFAALVRIGEQGKVSQNRLGRLAAMDVATIKGVVDRLRQKGLTLSEPDAEDKRRMLISLSPEGAALLERMTEVGRKVTEETLQPLRAEERAVFLDLLRKLT
ncbi:MarR family winged helix-turn-helix transcriptional regulator [Marimonas lutisalis]|uniref:MarR family winged helix-turn-helix transcriptional regulator n=1 Tax=Marimonas lutisalis TaxID=2545756 RepID=UPI0010F48E7C|nr:MarR family transcriptional regulator [Marimonas lutisalis]